MKPEEILEQSQQRVDSEEVLRRFDSCLERMHSILARMSSLLEQIELRHIDLELRELQRRTQTHETSQRLA